MASQDDQFGLSSFDDAIKTAPDGREWRIKALRPIPEEKCWNSSTIYAYDEEGNYIEFSSNGHVEMTRLDGFKIFWWVPPTKEDVILGRLGEGNTAIFYPDGSCKARRYNLDGEWWHWGVPVKKQMEICYEEEDDPPEPCGRCGSYHCICGIRDYSK